MIVNVEVIINVDVFVNVEVIVNVDVIINVDVIVNVEVIVNVDVIEGVYFVDNYSATSQGQRLFALALRFRRPFEKARGHIGRGRPAATAIQRGDGYGDECLNFRAFN